MTKQTQRVALITGGGRGIGAHTAKILADRGVAVALCARGLDDCRAVAAEIETAGGSAIAQTCDVADYRQAEAAVAQTIARFGRLDILINNAGILAPEAMIADADAGAWAQNVSINLTGAFHMARAALPHLTASDDGVLVNISTGAAHHALPGWSAYCASKAGLAMLTQCLLAEHGSDMRVYGFAPGTVWTAMQDAIRAQPINAVGALPEDALHSPARPATVIAWLTTKDATDLAGRELAVGDDALRRRAGVPAALDIGGR